MKETYIKNNSIIIFDHLEYLDYKIEVANKFVICKNKNMVLIFTPQKARTAGTTLWKLSDSWGRRKKILSYKRVVDNEIRHK